MPIITRRRFASGLLAAPALVTASRGAFAQFWPVPQITLVAPFPAGGTVDQMCRMVQQGLQTQLGATIIVENKPGAQGSIGANQVAKAKPDGGSGLFVFDTHAVNPSLQPLPFDTEKDLDPVLLIGHVAVNVFLGLAVGAATMALHRLRVGRTGAAQAA